MTIQFSDGIVILVLKERAKQKKKTLKKLKMQCEKINVGGFVYRDLIEIKRITDIDFSLRSLFGGKLF